MCLDNHNQPAHLSPRIREAGVHGARKVPAPFGLFNRHFFGQIINARHFEYKCKKNVLSSHKHVHAHKHIWRLDLKLHYSGTFYYDLFTV